MILFYGYPDDAPLQRAIEVAREREVDHGVIDQRHSYRHDLVLEISDAGADGHLRIADAIVPLGNVDAVYARPLTSVAVADARSAERARIFDQVMLEWLDIAECRVVNPPSVMHSNASKPFQAQAIAEAGFLVPETLVTSDPGAARAFWQRHGNVVFKSASGIRSIVRALDQAQAASLERLRDLPTQFQELVPGIDVRVHVVGTRVFAAQVRSDAIDYRYARHDGLDVDLDEITLRADTATACVSLAAYLGLPFCGIDLRRRPDGEHVCFEVNPMPGYSYFESETGQAIGEALVDYLMRGEG
jgi:glutathione synthase/RimK-type ligase-like ATP-grasp enzyme